MLHIALHLVVPMVVARLAYPRDWGRAAAVMLLASLLVDADHLLADPIYDPERCSMGFHPLHGWPMVGLYGALAALPLLVGAGGKSEGAAASEPHGAPEGGPEDPQHAGGPPGRFRRPTAPEGVHWAGVGLLLHMALDWGDCLL